MINDLVSIIVPVYNIGEYIEKCLKSIINQTYKQIEILLINDGSTDDSRKKCEGFGAKDSRIKIYDKPNGGLSSARNYGLSVAKGKFILFIDGDDYLNKYAIEYLLKVYYHSKVEPDLIEFRYIEVDETKTIDETINLNKFNYVICNQKQKMFNNLYEIGGEAASACTKLYKKEIFNDLRFKEGILHEDEYIITDILLKANNIIYLDNQLYYYVMRNGSIIKSDFRPKKMDIFLSLEHRIDILKELNFKDTLQKEYYRYFSMLLNLYCNAKLCGYKNECDAIKFKLKNLLKQINIDCTGKMKIFEYLCRLNVNNINFYYLLRKYFGKI